MQTKVLDKKTLIKENRALRKQLLECKRLEEQLRQLAYYDDTTSLPNRLFFNERLHEALIQENATVSILIIDLDRFKSFNDTLGHENGNALLRLVAKRISNSLPHNALLYRYGGDEFTVLVFEAGTTQTAAVADGALKSLHEPIALAGDEFYVSASIGASHYPTEATNISELMQHADIAMYRAKENGGGGFCLYDATLGKQVVKRMKLETGLRRAIINNEMWLEYQPQVDLDTQGILAVEALLRWKHPDHGLMRTSEFIKIAEETGQIIAIGEWVLQEVFIQASKWQKAGIRSFKVAVNVSSRQVEKHNFIAFMKQLLSDYQVPAECIELEITEHIFIKHKREAIYTIRALKEMGFSLAIDDFGTGYSALSYLHHFPIDTLKIDHSFITNLHLDKNNKAITSAIVAMANHLQMRTVAECVEHVAQVDILKTMHCEAAQGYYYTKPLVQKELSGWLNRGVRPH